MWAVHPKPPDGDPADQSYLRNRRSRRACVRSPTAVPTSSRADLTMPTLPALSTGSKDASPVAGKCVDTRSGHIPSSERRSGVSRSGFSDKGAIKHAPLELQPNSLTSMFGRIEPLQVPQRAMTREAPGAASERNCAANRDGPGPDVDQRCADQSSRYRAEGGRLRVACHVTSVEREPSGDDPQLPPYDADSGGGT